MTSLIERVCEVARADGASRVTDIHVACGEVSGVIPDALEFCFDVCTAGTCAEGASLDIEMVPAAWRCDECGAVSRDVDDRNIPLCSVCGGRALRIVEGREFRLTSIKVV